MWWLQVAGGIVAASVAAGWFAQLAEREAAELRACEVAMVAGSGECDYWRRQCERRPGCVFGEYWPAERARLRQHDQEREDDLPPLEGGDGREFLV